MGKLSIFDKGDKVTVELASERDDILNTLVDEVKRGTSETMLLRKATEVQEWGGETAEMLIEDGKIEIEEDE